MFNNNHYYNARLKKGLKSIARKFDADYDILEAIKKRFPHISFHKEARNSTDQQLLGENICIPSKAQLRTKERIFCADLRGIINNILVPNLNQTTDPQVRQLIKKEISKVIGLIHELENHDILKINQSYSSTSAVDEGLLRQFFLDAGGKFLHENLNRFNSYAIITLNLGELSSFSCDEFQNEDLVLTRIGLFTTLIAQSLKGLNTFALGGLNIRSTNMNVAPSVNLELNKTFGTNFWDIEYNIVMPQTEVGAFEKVWQKILKAHKIKNAFPVVQVEDFSTFTMLCKVFQPLCAHEIGEASEQNFNTTSKEYEVNRLDSYNWVNLFRVLRKLSLSCRLVMQNVKIVETPEAVELAFNPKASRHDNIFYEKDSIAPVIRVKKPVKGRGDGYVYRA